MIRVAQPGFKRVIAMDSLHYGHDNYRMVWGIPFAGMAALSIAFGVFLLNSLPVQPIAFSFLYICAIFVAAVGGRRRWVIVCTAASCAMLALGSFLYAYGPVASLHDVVRLVLDLVVISAVAAYTLKEIALSERLRAQTLLLDQTHDSVTVRDLDGAIRYWNRGASEMYGWALDEARGRIFSRLLKSETAQSLESIKAILCRAGVWEGEILNYSKAGHAIVMNCRWSLLLDERRKPTRVLETANDVTARKLADQEVRLSEARYRSLFETTGIAIWECDVSQVTHRMEMLRASERRNLRKYVKEHHGFIKELIELTVAK
ncbi:MAG: sensor histidine kinase, partial [Tardiphaga sp.]|nr:sensor histidine kinase [Tardiphaga sp.]